jgi:exopolysaccharide biosynthesis polyprenyl glycosylphosphotransferase
MLKEHSYFVKQAIATIDCLLLAGCFFLSYWLTGKYTELLPVYLYWYIPVGFTFFYLYFAWTRSLFSVLNFGWDRGVARRVFMIFLSAEIMGGAILYFIPGQYESRHLSLMFGGISFLVILSEKLLLCWFFLTMRRNNRNTTPVLLFGCGRQAANTLREIADHPESGLRVVRKVDPNVSPAEFEEVFFILPRSLTHKGFRIDPYLQVCEEMGRMARVFLNISSATLFARWRHHAFMGESTLISHTVELDPDQVIFKRLFDIVGSLVGMMILIGLYPFIALALKFTSKGPIMFKQVRVGKNGKRFILYKFRSMYMDAEKRKKELAALNELKGAAFKMKNDPRITPLGKILRKLSLDELPQFLNVLKGEMSLVGTRPPTPDEVRQYSQWHFRRISIRPGITGLWQVSGRNKITDFDEIVKLDLKYIDTWSLWRDIVIIFKTVGVVFHRGEAY